MSCRFRLKYLRRASFPSVYNVTGQKVATLVNNEKLAAGAQSRDVAGRSSCKRCVSGAIDERFAHFDAEDFAGEITCFDSHTLSLPNVMSADEVQPYRPHSRASIGTRLRKISNGFRPTCSAIAIDGRGESRRLRTRLAALRETIQRVGDGQFWSWFCRRGDRPQTSGNS